MLISVSFTAVSPVVSRLNNYNNLIYSSCGRTLPQRRADVTRRASLAVEECAETSAALFFLRCSSKKKKKKQEKK